MLLTVLAECLGHGVEPLLTGGKRSYIHLSWEGRNIGKDGMRCTSGEADMWCVLMGLHSLTKTTQLFRQHLYIEIYKNRKRICAKITCTQQRLHFR